MSSSPSTLTREAGTSASSARSARRRPSISHILIGLAALLAFALNFLALQERDATRLVAVSAAPIAAGSVVTESDIRWAPIPESFEGSSDLIFEEDAHEVGGWVAGRSLAAGAVIDRSSLLAPGSSEGLRTMSVPIGAEHAAGATLMVGDRVDVISMVDGEPRYVAVDLEVVGHADINQGALSGGSAYHVLLAVEASDALALAKAIDDGALEIIRSTGAALLEVDE